MNATTTDRTIRDLPRLTSLRAFAALVVFAFHIGHDTGWMPGVDVFDNGYIGVAFFFVLSGFVLTWSTHPGTTARTFWTRRFARVYPSHLVMAVVAVLAPVTAFEPTWPAAVANVLLVQAWFPQWDIVFGLNAPSWSLSCEAFFYVVAPFVIATSRHWRTRVAVGVFAGWALVMSGTAIAAGLASPELDVIAYTNPVVRSGEFALGILLATLVSRGWRPRLPLVLVTAMVVGVVIALVGRTLPQSLVDVVFVPLFALVVLSAAVADLGGARGVLHRRLFTYAGEVSFAFYLTHELVIMNLAHVVGRNAPGPAGAVWALSAFILAAVTAVALHHGVERPAQRWIRTQLLPRPSLVAPVIR